MSLIIDTLNNFFKYNFLQHFSKQPFLPRTLVIYVNYKCNASCIMCNIWKTDKLLDDENQISLESFKRIFSDPLFSKIEHVDLNGGEPSLRTDLADIIDIIIKKFPKLKLITMSTNGLLTDRISSVAKHASEICRLNKIKFSITFSIHGTGKTLERINGVKGAFDKVARTLKEVRSINKENDFFLSVNCVLTDLNILGAHKLLEWGRQEELNINFSLGEVRERFRNEDTGPRTFISKGKKEFLVKFLRELAGNKRPGKPAAYKYHNLAQMIEFDEEREQACHYRLGGVVLGPYRELYYCPHSNVIGDCLKESAYKIYYNKENLKYRRNGLINNECRKCPPYTFNRLEVQKDLLKYLKFLLSGNVFRNHFFIS